MHACSAADTLTLGGVGLRQYSSETANSCEEIVHEWSGQFAYLGRGEGVDHGFSRCQFPLGAASALGDQGRVHSSLEGVEVFSELLACLAGLEPRPA